MKRCQGRKENTAAAAARKRGHGKRRERPPLPFPVSLIPRRRFFLCEIPCSKLCLYLCGVCVCVLGGRKSLSSIHHHRSSELGVEVVPPPGKRCFVVVVGCACFVCKGSPPSLSFVALLWGRRGAVHGFYVVSLRALQGGRRFFVS